MEAKDLISKLLCNVDQRLGTKGAEEIKVVMCPFKMARYLRPIETDSTAICVHSTFHV